MGDAALMHSELLGVRMSANTVAKVDKLVARRGIAVLRPPLDPDALRRLPRGTFGRELAEFCTANKITPVTISGTFDADALRRMAAVARYVVTHDMLHVLLGRDTSISDEIGVTGFVVGQGYFRRAWLVFSLQCVLGVLLLPHRAARTLARLRDGFRLGKRAPNLLAEPLEDFFAEDLEHLRRRLGLR